MVGEFSEMYGRYVDILYKKDSIQKSPTPLMVNGIIRDDSIHFISLENAIIRYEDTGIDLRKNHSVAKNIIGSVSVVEKPAEYLEVRLTDESISSAFNTYLRASNGEFNLKDYLELLRANSKENYHEICDEYTARTLKLNKVKRDYYSITNGLILSDRKL